VAAACVAACGPGAQGSPSTVLIVGVQSEPMSGAIGTLHITTTVDGATSSDEVLAFDAAMLDSNGKPIGHEVKLVPPSGDPTAKVGVEVDGYTQAGWTPGSSGPPAVLVRTAEAQFVPSRTELLRVVLQGQCLLGLPGGPPGAPTCVAPLTCVAGSCQDDTVPASSLEPYASNWATNAPDICKPTNAGPPKVDVGYGQTDYLPLTDGQTIQLEQGPQGGHHVWVAVRQENLKQSGSTTTITSVQPDTGLVGPRTAFVFTFDPDEGGYCKLSGLRYQIDVGGLDYHQFLGHPLDITVTITDASGATGRGVAHIEIAPTIDCPMGTPGC
jgi:hypothetical protein